MKYKFQFFICTTIFLMGYLSNFLMPVSHFSQYFQRLNNDVVAEKNIINNTVDKMNGAMADAKKNNRNPLVQSGEVGSTTIKSNNHELAVEPEDLTLLKNELAALREYRLQTEIKKHAEVLRSTGGESVEAINNNFKHEPLDSAWAAKKELLLNNFIEQSGALARVPHLAAECRSKQCKLSVLSDDQFYLSKLTDSLGKVIEEHGSSFLTYFTVVDEKNHTTNIYFDRNADESQQNNGVSK